MRQLIPLLFLFFQLYAQPQPPTTPRKSSKAPQRKPGPKASKTSDNQKIPNALTALENELASEVAAREKLENAVQKENKTPPEGWLKWSTIINAAATFCIAILALFQWLVIRKQAEGMEAGLIETRKSADAAKKSADALINSERAWLIENIDINGMQIRLQFKNWGRTPAHFIEVRFEYVTSERDSLWPIDYGAIEELIFPPTPVPPGAPTDTHTVDLRSGANFDILTNWRHIVGIVRYRDLGNDVRTITVYHALNPVGPPRWLRAGPPEANLYT